MLRFNCQIYSHTTRTRTLFLKLRFSANLSPGAGNLRKMLSKMRLSIKSSIVW